MQTINADAVIDEPANDRDAAHDAAVYELDVRDITDTPAARAIKIMPTRIYAFAEMLQMAQAFAKSGLFRDDRNENAALAKILAGADLGFSPIQAMTQIMIVDGKPTLSAPSVGALVKRSQRYDYRVVKIDNKECTLEFLEWKQHAGYSTFTIADAQNAGLANKDVWRKYPRNMCFSRAMTNGARWYAAEAFNGAIYTPEELGADVDITPDGDMVLRNKPLPSAPVDAKPPTPSAPTKASVTQSLPIAEAPHKIEPTAIVRSNTASNRNAWMARLGELEAEMQISDKQRVDILAMRYSKASKNELTKDELVDYGSWLKEQAAEMRAYYEHLRAEADAAAADAANEIEMQSTDDNEYPPIEGD